MKSLKEHLNESILNETSIEEAAKPLYQPETGDELYELVNWLIERRGNKADLNDIDTSLIVDMSDMFRNSDFNGDISKWDVSKVKDMSYMFMDSEFNGDISKWDVRKVKFMTDMFKDSPLEGNEPEWYKRK